MLKDIEKTKKVLIDGIKEFVYEANADGIVVGLSGGIDSTLATWLAVQAMGSENVYGLILPSGGESKLDSRLAHQVAEWLNLIGNTLSVPIEEGLITLLDAFQAVPLPEYHKSSVAFKSRIRMAMLYYYAALLKVKTKKTLLVMGSCNKSERFVGYVVKYGDGGVDFEPLGSLLKTDVFELAQSIKGFPKDVLERTPSRRVWVDDRELDMSYRELDHLIENYEYVVGTEGIEAFKRMQGRRTSMPPSNILMNDEDTKDKKITYETLDNYINILLTGNFEQWRSLDKEVKAQILNMNDNARHKMEAPPIIHLYGENR